MQVRKNIFYGFIGILLPVCLCGTASAATIPLSGTETTTRTIFSTNDYSLTGNYTLDIASATNSYGLNVLSNANIDFTNYKTTITIHDTADANGAAIGIGSNATVKIKGDIVTEAKAPNPISGIEMWNVSGAKLEFTGTITTYGNNSTALYTSGANISTIDATILTEQRHPLKSLAQSPCTPLRLLWIAIIIPQAWQQAVLKQHSY